MDTRNPTSKLILTILAGVATWEREVMLERQREGIAKAKSEGKYKGRKPTARAKTDQITTLAAEGMTREAIAAQLKVGVISLPFQSDNCLKSLFGTMSTPVRNAVSISICLPKFRARAR